MLYVPIHLFILQFLKYSILHIEEEETVAIFQRVDHVRLSLVTSCGNKLMEPNLILELFLQHSSSGWAKPSKVALTMKKRRGITPSIACLWLTDSRSPLAVKLRASRGKSVRLRLKWVRPLSEVNILFICSLMSSPVRGHHSCTDRSSAYAHYCYSFPYSHSCY